MLRTDQEVKKISDFLSDFTTIKNDLIDQRKEFTFYLLADEGEPNENSTFVRFLMLIADDLIEEANKLIYVLQNLSDNGIRQQEKMKELYDQITAIHSETNDRLNSI